MTIPASRPATEFVPAAQGLGTGMGSMGPFPPSRLKNSPKLASQSGLSAIRTASLVMVESADRTAWEAMSLEIEHPAWSKVQLPPGTTAQPIAGSDIAALMIKGKKIDHVAAFSPYTGAWSMQHLLKPVEEQINPVVGPGSALYQAGNDFYAFSARRGSWGVLHLEGDEEATATTSPTDIEVMQGNRLYVFSLKQGEWSKGVAAYLRPSSAGPERVAPIGGQQPRR